MPARDGKARFRASAVAWATVSERSFRGEVFHEGSVRLFGRECFRVADQPSRQAVQLAIWEWSQRMGKQVEWQYLSRAKKG